MARISTGQTFGETSRATAARLLGGIEQTSTPGALAQAEINAPSLQPQAAPVETFQQVGVPTVGGPPKVFAPPELPAPNQDLANLAKSLGGFSSALEEFGSSMLALKKQQAEQDKATGKAIATQVSAVAPGYENIDTAIRSLNKLQEAQFDPQRAQLITYLQAQAGGPLRQANIAYQTEQRLQSYLSLPGRFKEYVHPDGRRYNQLTEAEARSVIARLGPTPSATWEPQALIATSEQGSQQFVAAMSAWREGRAAYNRELSQEAAPKVLSNAVTRLASGTDYRVVAQQFGPEGQQLWSSLSLNPGDFRAAFGDKGLETLANAVAVQTNGDPRLATTLGKSVLDWLAVTPFGPNGEPLIARFGPSPEQVTRKFYAAVFKQTKEDRAQTDESLGFGAQDQARSDAAKTFTPSVLADPVALAQKQEDLIQGALNSKQPIAWKNAYVQEINRFVETGKGYSATTEKEAELYWQQKMTDDQSTNWSNGIATDDRLGFDAQRRLMGLNKSNQDRVLNEKRALVNQSLKDWEKRVMSVLAPGGQGLTADEAGRYREARARAYTDLMGMADQNPNTTHVEFQQMVNKAMEGRNFGLRELEQRPVERSNKPAPGISGANIVAPLKGGATSIGDVRQNTDLHRDYLQQPLLGKLALGGEMDNLMLGRPLTPGTKNMIRRLQSIDKQLKPSDIMLQQFMKHGIAVPDNVKEKLRQLDQSDLVSQSALTSSGFAMVQPSTALDAVQRTWRRLAAATGDTLVPPAAAAQPVIATASGGGGRGGGGGRNSTIGQRSAIVKAAQQLGIRPVDLAAVISLETGGTFAKDIRGGEGGNYQGLIQFGPTERRTYGYRSNMNFEQQVLGPVVRYLKARGVKPGHGVKEVYAAILTGNVANIAQGGLDWEDVNKTSVRKALPSLTKGGHYQNAIRFLRGS